MRIRNNVSWEKYYAAKKNGVENNRVNLGVNQTHFELRQEQR